MSQKLAALAVEAVASFDKKLCRQHSLVLRIDDAEDTHRFAPFRAAPDATRRKHRNA